MLPLCGPCDPPCSLLSLRDERPYSVALVPVLVDVSVVAAVVAAVPAPAPAAVAAPAVSDSTSPSPPALRAGEYMYRGCGDDAECTDASLSKPKDSLWLSPSASLLA